LEVHPFSYRAPWVSVMVPLPPKVYVRAENAENAAYIVLRSLAGARLLT
jgi:hypothetical protein